MGKGRRRLVSELVDDESIHYWEFHTELILGGGMKPDEADVRKAQRESALTTDEERDQSLYWSKVYGKKIITTYA